MTPLEFRREEGWLAAARRRRKVALLGAVLASVLAFSRAANARDDIIVQLDPATAFVTMAIDGFGSDIALADGFISLETDDATCVASPTHPCSYVLNTLQFDLVGFVLPTDVGDYDVDTPFSVVSGPIVLLDAGGGLEIPAGVPSTGGGTISGPGVDTGVQQSDQPLSSPFGISLDVARQTLSVHGTFSTSLEGHVASGAIRATGIHPFLNVPPVASAGPDRTVVCAGNVTLSAAGSTDANDSIVLYRWSEGGVVLATVDASTGSSASIPFALGTHTVTLEAFDSFGGRGTDTVVVNVTDAPAFTSVPGPLTTTVCGALNVGQATATWCGAVTVTNNAPASFPFGVTTVTWTATAANGKTATAKQRVEVELGDNPACCPAGYNVLLGTSNNQTLTGTSGNDCILGRGGQDTISGGGGNDIISGGDGDDVINAGPGNDTVFGGSGQDQIVGDVGNDVLKGGDGDDVINGGPGNDRLSGGQGQDQLLGGDSDDILIGETGDDTLNAAAGNDQLVGSGLHDTCSGGTGLNLFSSCQNKPDVSPSFVVLDSCADGVLDALETAPDCGGPACDACQAGGACASGADCETNVCSAAGMCQAQVPGGSPLQGLLTFSTDWGGGYCAVLNVKNPSRSAIAGYSANIDTNGSTIYTTWSGNFSTTHGPVTITPSLPSNQSIPAHQTNSSIGFCANRDSATSGKLPFIVNTSGGSF